MSAVLLGCSQSLLAQAAPAPAPVGPPAEEPAVEFSAAQLSFDNEADVVTASGDVRMNREGNRVRADSVTWNRRTGEVLATGNVTVVNPGGDTAYGDRVTLTDSLRDGVVDNLLLVLADGGRLAARSGNRQSDVTTLRDAAYTPCPVVDGETGCPREPSWQVTAVRIVHDPAGKRLTFTNSQLRVFGIALPAIPRFVIPLGNEGATGLLAPDLRYSRVNGLELAQPFYWRLAPNRDLTITPHVYSKVLPALAGQYRALTSNGAYQIGGMFTYSSLIPVVGPVATRQREFRGYLNASGRFQLDPYWSISGSIRRATDRTFLRRYDITSDDRLRSVIRGERQGLDSFFAANAWSFQTLRPGESQGQSPLVVPEIDYRLRLTDPLLGGQAKLQLNALAITRTEGQDTQRVFAAGRWDLRRLTNLGQELVLTAYARGDAYHTAQTALTPTIAYRGREGVRARAVVAAAAELRWPMIGAFLSGTQRLTPRVQFVASPHTRNLAIPNEDARSVDLEDSNLFALNRFPGYDRWEDGARLTYGLDWQYDRPGLAISANIGQSYRLERRDTLFPDGTGLTGRVSDIVGRTSVKFRRLIEFTHRYRIDKDNFSLRRNEIDATVGGRQTYAVLGYLKLDRNIGPQLEDLRDREEVRLGGRVQVTRYISVFGSTIIDLTNRAEDPISVADGYEPVRHRLGIAYSDDCLDLGLTWRREYQTTGDARAGNSFLVRLAFRGLGR